MFDCYFLATTVFDWRKTSVWKNRGVWVIPPLCSMMFVVDTTTIKIWVSFQNFEWVFKILSECLKFWVSFKILSEFSKFWVSFLSGIRLKFWNFEALFWAESGVINQNIKAFCNLKQCIILITHYQKGETNSWQQL